VPLRPNQFNGQAFGRPLGSLPLVMFPAAALRIFCHPDVEGTIRAAEDVAVVHSGQLETCPSASSGQSSCQMKTLPLGKLGTKFSKNENFGGGGS
jgi:hypothetical protein